MIACVDNDQRQKDLGSVYRTFHSCKSFPGFGHVGKIFDVLLQTSGNVCPPVLHKLVGAYYGKASIRECENFL